jgi:hypothetical protein
MERLVLLLVKAIHMQMQKEKLLREGLQLVIFPFAKKVTLAQLLSLSRTASNTCPVRMAWKELPNLALLAKCTVHRYRHVMSKVWWFALPIQLVLLLQNQQLLPPSPPSLTLLPRIYSIIQPLKEMKRLLIRNHS